MTKSSLGSRRSRFPASLVLVNFILSWKKCWRYWQVSVFFVSLKLKPATSGATYCTSFGCFFFVSCFVLKEIQHWKTWAYREASLCIFILVLDHDSSRDQRMYCILCCQEPSVFYIKAIDAIINSIVKTRINVLTLSNCLFLSLSRILNT